MACVVFSCTLMKIDPPAPPLPPLTPAGSRLSSFLAFQSSTGRGRKSLTPTLGFTSNEKSGSEKTPVMLIVCW